MDGVAGADRSAEVQALGDIDRSRPGKPVGDRRRDRAGGQEIRAAAIAASEKITDRQPATVEAAALAAESRAGLLPGFIVDGPFGYDVAVSRAAAEAKGLAASPLAGEADLILFPNIEAANATAKAWKFHGGARTGSLVLGARMPVLLNSRSDGAERRVLGLLVAICTLAGQ